MSDEQSPYDQWMERLNDARVAVATAQENLRSTIVMARASGMTLRDVHEATGISITTIRKYTQEETGATRIRIPPP